MENNILEEKILELVMQRYKSTGGANGVDFNEIGTILQMEPQERNAFISKMVEEKKIAPIYHLNGVSYTWPKNQKEINPSAYSKETDT